MLSKSKRVLLDLKSFRINPIMSHPESWVKTIILWVVTELRFSVSSERETIVWYCALRERPESRNRAHGVLVLSGGF